MTIIKHYIGLIDGYLQKKESYDYISIITLVVSV